MTIAIKPTASGSTIEQNGSTILTVDGSGNITPSNDLYPKGPTFAVGLSADQSISSATYTKCTLDSEDFDTNSNYDNVTNYRFTPTVAGYYQINATMRFEGTNMINNTVAIYKNGSQARILGTNRVTVSSPVIISGSHVIYLNGTTDYIELYGYVSGTSLFFGVAGTVNNCHMSASLVSV